MPTSFTRVWLALALCAFGASARAQSDTEVSASTALYVRSDTDHTTVISPRVRVAAPVSSTTRVDAVYSADVWSSASIDIRAAASKRVTEQRDELDAGITQTWDDLTLRAGYRYSDEHDYASHGGNLRVAYDFAQRATTLAFTASGSFDRVGRAGDPAFWREASLASGRIELTQVADTHMFVQVAYEFARQAGYLSSPYRFVRVGDSLGPALGPCVFPSTQCEREVSPSQRLRHAAVLSVRRALTDVLSIGASYRFYADDWALQSHTLRVDVAWMLGDRCLIGVDYRFYDQGAAAHYRPVYPADPLSEFRTSDKELSPLTSHRVGVEVSQTWLIDGLDRKLTVALLAAPSYFVYHDFPWLDDIRGIESSVSVELVL